MFFEFFSWWWSKSLFVNDLAFSSVVVWHDQWQRGLRVSYSTNKNNGFAKIDQLQTTNKVIGKSLHHLNEHNRTRFQLISTMKNKKSTITTLQYRGTILFNYRSHTSSNRTAVDLSFDFWFDACRQNCWSSQSAILADFVGW